MQPWPDGEVVGPALGWRSCVHHAQWDCDSQSFQAQPARTPRRVITRMLAPQRAASALPCPAPAAAETKTLRGASSPGWGWA